MAKYNQADAIATSMNDILNSSDQQKYIEKLAFKRVSDEEQTSEIEVELTAQLDSKAQTMPGSQSAPSSPKVCMVCMKPTTMDCKCMAVFGGKCGVNGKCVPGCPCGCTAKTAEEIADEMTKVAFSTLIKVSEQLELAGFPQLSVFSLKMADKLVSEAKKKKAPKKKDKKDKKESKKEESSKSKSKEEKSKKSSK